jgi:drug/metabolite transporter (DMT)-like permease
MLLGLVAFSAKALLTTRFARKDFLKVSLLGIAYFSGFPICLTFGLEFTTSGRAGIVFATMPVWTIIIASFFQIEKLNATKITAILLAFGGVVLSLSSNLSDNNGQILTGDILITIGVISASIFTVFAKGLIKNYGSQPVMIYGLLSGVVFMFLIALLFGSPFAGSLDFNINGWFYVFILGIPSGALMIYFWGLALRMISPTQAAICSGFNPLTAILAGAILLGEEITSLFLIGFLCVISAVIFLQIANKNE